jgi:multiple sugar transport system permease protein/raffinose/stachyose/melibiose transport system permease protein
VVLFLPFITPAVVVGQIMGQFFAPGGGLASTLLRGAGLPWRWVGDPAFAGVLGVFTGAWHWVGFYTVVLVAGLLNIPREVSDAARVDGARGWGLFRRITLPLTGQIMVLVLLLLVLNAVQEPGGIAGQPLVTSTLKDIVFGGLVTFGAGAAGGVIVAVATLAVSVAIIALFRPRWSY